MLAILHLRPLDGFGSYEDKYPQVLEKFDQSYDDPQEDFDNGYHDQDDDGGDKDGDDIIKFKIDHIWIFL